VQALGPNSAAIGEFNPKEIKSLIKRSAYEKIKKELLSASGR
jgi:hypothetical protein